MTATASQVAQFVNPTDGAINVNVSQPITWSTALNADAYYLYVGTTQGAKDLVNTGEMAGTSYLASALPSGQTLYAQVIDRVVPVSSTRAAELVKLLENIYRSVNIALVNELKLPPVKIHWPPKLFRLMSSI